MRWLARHTLFMVYIHYGRFNELMALMVEG